MRRFRFRLETLLRVRCLEEDRRQQDLAHMRRRVLDRVEEIAFVDERVGQEQEALREALCRGGGVELLLEAQSYLAVLRTNRSRLLADLDRLRSKEESLRRALVEASRARRALERLRERRREEYRRDAARTERRFLDDIAATRYVVPAPGAGGDRGSALTGLMLLCTLFFLTVVGFVVVLWGGGMLDGEKVDAVVDVIAGRPVGEKRPALPEGRIEEMTEEERYLIAEAADRRLVAMRTALEAKERAIEIERQTHRDALAKEQEQLDLEWERLEARGREVEARAEALAAGGPERTGIDPERLERIAGLVRALPPEQGVELLRSETNETIAAMLLILKPRDAAKVLQAFLENEDYRVGDRARAILAIVRAGGPGGATEPVSAGGDEEAALPAADTSENE